MMNRIKSVLSNRWPTLHAAFQSSLDASVMKVRLSNPRAKETDYVYEIFQSSVKDMDQALKRTLLGMGIHSAVSGVFCHQCPYVKLTKPAANGNDRCEIGDLLVTVRYRDQQHYHNWALLLQFKMEESLPVQLDTHSPQYDLYNKWTPFSYDATYMPKREMVITDPIPHDGGKYGLIVQYPLIWPYPQTFSKVSDMHGMEKPLGLDIVDVILGLSGRSFQHRPSVETDWSQLIWDLLQQTASRLVNLKSSGVSKAPRGNIHTLVVTANNTIPSLLMTAKLSGTDFGKNWSSQSFSDEIGPEGGISTIFFEFWDEVD